MMRAVVLAVFVSVSGVRFQNMEVAEDDDQMKQFTEPSPSSASPQRGNKYIDVVNGRQVGLACKVSKWQAWTTCTKTCGTGVRNRVRTVIAEPTGAGAPCPHIAEQETCHEEECLQNLDGKLWGLAPGAGKRKNRHHLR